MKHASHVGKWYMGDLRTRSRTTSATILLDVYSTFLPKGEHRRPLDPGRTTSTVLRRTTMQQVALASRDSPPGAKMQ